MKKSSNDKGRAIVDPALVFAISRLPIANGSLLEAVTSAYNSFAAWPGSASCSQGPRTAWSPANQAASFPGVSAGTHGHLREGTKAMRSSYSNRCFHSVLRCFIVRRDTSAGQPKCSIYLNVSCARCRIQDNIAHVGRYNSICAVMCQIERCPPTACSFSVDLKIGIISSRT